MLNIRLPFVNRLEQVFKTYIQMQSHQEKIIGESDSSSKFQNFIFLSNPKRAFMTPADL